jgi:transposase-like protein
MAALLSLTWLRLATSSSARFGGRQPYLFVRKIPYVIVEETLAYYAFPEEHWRRVRTNNPLERILREIRRRTRALAKI